ncbi:MAG: NTP transferase domain-containing protein [Candidatus Didemnitutus sp.]|nr:NTP transferase domain-containing protein [Candidatus Didemnitutus sp.]
MIDEILILAAGLGSRMAAITHDRPKCMAPFQGGTFLSRLLQQLSPHRPRRIHIVGGYQVEALRRYLENAEFAGLPFNVITNSEFARTNSLASCALALAEARGQLLVLNSDVVYDAEVIRRMVTHSAPFAFALDRSCYSEESEKIALRGDGLAVQIAKTLTAAEAAGCSLDLYRFNTESDDGAWRGMLANFLARPNTSRRLFEDFIDFTLIARPWECVDVSGLEWYEIDTVEELKEAEALFNQLKL